MNRSSATFDDEGLAMPESQAAAKVIARCAELAACTDRDGVIERTFLSPAMERCHQLVGQWMQSAGMQVYVDTAGNLRGLYDGSQADAPRLILGSHLDTVPDAGKYDGILGVILAISLVESLQGKRLMFAIEVFGFSDEEGVRYGLPFIGSRAVVDALTSTHRQLLDVGGISLATALASFASAHVHLVPPLLHPRSRAYLEFHIEQGPVLEEANQPLCVVAAIAGQTRATFTFCGRAGHAGTTPMSLRRDAMTAAAEWILAVESTARATAGLVASTGRVSCEPGAGNIIPGLVRCSLDVRAANDTVRHRAFEAILQSALGIARARAIEVSHTIDSEQPMVPLDSALIQLAQQSIVEAGSTASPMTSGAGHDAMILAPHLPSAMIFLRNPGGVSHHPEESVLPSDVEAALRAGIHFFQHFENWIGIEDHL